MCLRVCERGNLLKRNMKFEVGRSTTTILKSIHHVSFVVWACSFSLQSFHSNMFSSWIFDFVSCSVGSIVHAYPNTRKYPCMYNGCNSVAFEVFFGGKKSVKNIIYVCSTSVCLYEVAKTYLHLKRKFRPNEWIFVSFIIIFSNKNETTSKMKMTKKENPFREKYCLEL